MVKRVLAGVFAGFVLLLVLGALASRLGLVAVHIPRPQGHFFWFLSRALGITAYVALTLELGFGLLLSTSVGDRLLSRARSVEVHRWLSSVSIVLIVMHGLVLMGDGYVRFDVLDVLVPFASSYARLGVGLGVLAAYLGVAVHGSFQLRKRLGARAYRLLHYASFPMFWLATVHGLLAGSDASAFLMRTLYGVSAGLILWLTFYRVIVALSCFLRRVMP